MHKESIRFNLWRNGVKQTIFSFYAYVVKAIGTLLQTDSSYFKWKEMEHEVCKVHLAIIIAAVTDNKYFQIQAMSNNKEIKSNSNNRFLSALSEGTVLVC